MYFSIANCVWMSIGIGSQRELRYKNKHISTSELFSRFYWLWNYVFFLILSQNKSQKKNNVVVNVNRFVMILIVQKSIFKKKKNSTRFMFIYCLFEFFLKKKQSYGKELITKTQCDKYRGTFEVKDACCGQCTLPTTTTESTTTEMPPPGTTPIDGATTTIPDDCEYDDFSDVCVCVVLMLLSICLCVTRGKTIK